MKALVLTEYNEFELSEVPEPNLAADEVLVAVKACGICGSDVHGMDGSTGRRRPPIIMGHEAAGTIARVGRDVKDWSAGDRVTFDSTIYCGECEFCRRGEVNLCNNRRVLGVSCEEYRRNGAFAEYVAVPQRVLYRLPNGLPFEHAALIEPFAIALHAVKRANVKPSDAAVVIGAGMIGLAIVQMLRAIGCRTIVSVDIDDSRLELAKACGATHTVNSGEPEPLAGIQKVIGEEGADVALEAVGISTTVDLAARSVRKGGAVALVGNVAPKIEFPLQVAVTRELSVFGCCASQGDYPECISLMSEGKLQPEKLLSAVAPLEEGPKWFERLHRKEPGLLKVILANHE